MWSYPIMFECLLLLLCMCVCVYGDYSCFFNVDVCASLRFWQYINNHLWLVITCISTCSSRWQINVKSTRHCKNGKTSYIYWSSTCVFKLCQIKHLVFCDVLKVRIVFVFISTVSSHDLIWCCIIFLDLTKFNIYIFTCLHKVLSS